MSLKRSSKPPARPPPPRVGLPVGMSFKKLEQGHEEEDEDVTISDKYASIVQHARSASAASVASRSSVAESNGAHSASTLVSATSKTDSGTTVAEEEAASSQRKGGKYVEYKEMLYGLKGRIQEKITKTIEDISGESSTTSRIQERLGKPSEDVSSNSTSNCKVKEISKTAEDAPGDTSSRVSLDSEQEVPMASDQQSDATTASEENPRETILKATSVKVQAAITETDAKPTSVSRPARQDSEEKQGAGETSFKAEALQSTCSAASDDKGNDCTVLHEDHLSQEPFEDFAGNNDTNTTLRFRSKMKLQTETSVPVEPAAGPSTVKTTVTVAEGDNHQSTNRMPAGSDNNSKPEPAKSKPFKHLISLDLLGSHWQKGVALILFFFVFFILYMPPYICGLIMGCVLTSSCLAMYTWIMQPPPVKEAPTLTPLEDMPPMEIPEMDETNFADGVYKGWMNEITNYNPSQYHINQTFSIFVTLDGTKLRLQRPKNAVPRRGMHDEKLNTAVFIHQRHFELKGSRVLLQPPELIRKRMWSKKYPVCLALAEKGTKTVPDALVDSSDIAETESGFQVVSEEACDSSVLYLFARTSREKEEWYRRFQAATEGKPLPNAVLEMRRAIDLLRLSHPKRLSSDGAVLQRNNSTESQLSAASDAPDVEAEVERVDPAVEFTRYMGYLLPTSTFTQLLSSSKSGAVPRSPFTGSIICDSQLYWLNGLIGRCFFDFLRDAWWANKVKDKLQRKLSKIHVPYFIEELQVTAIDLGKGVPVIKRAANPYLDERGFWAELDVSYGGGFTMTIETKMNLMKLKRSGQDQNNAMTKATSERSPVTDSEEEDSAESSTDEEEETAASPEEKESGSKKLLKYLDKLTSSKYFQQATEYKYIKRAMENVSNTPLQLQVSVKSLVGKLAINIPPPPSDRLWYGFRGPPRLYLVAKPQVGERVVTITHITDWIERKLELEFQRVFVMPNMDDLVIPILRSSGGGIAAGGQGHSRSPSDSYPSVPLE